MNYFKNLSSKDAVYILVTLNIFFYILLKVTSFFLILFGHNFSDYRALSIVSLPLYYLDILHRPWTLIIHPLFNVSLISLLIHVSVIKIFGKVIEIHLGKKKLLCSYFVSAILGALIVVIFYNIVPTLVPYVFITSLVGPGGSIMFIIGCSCALVPTHRINLWFTTCNIKLCALYTFIVYILLISMSMQLYILSFVSFILSYMYISYLKRPN